MVSDLDWSLTYDEICRNLEINCLDDDISALYLSKFESKSHFLWKRLKYLTGRPFIVIGNSPDVSQEDFIKAYEKNEVIVVGDSALRLIPSGIVPEIIVSDLDGSIPDIVLRVQEGSILFLHSHGDNMNKIEENIQGFDGFYIPTRQGRRPKSMFNPCGFTDGDRAVMIAKFLGAKRIRLFGFSFERAYEKGNTVLKMKKLQFAKKIIESVKDVEILYV
ncbi:6-hydroxymethylpterin diphosphokinase MptE-like protein [Cuniculiplasma sp. SKW4]|uniref:6-hydroxymethylpterin diphosphokinase MptE-like protein n=1 Tax=Cuniculiplasma sp. SKW4 TaxID=3400171 RepID=UPI003FCF6F97